MAKAADVVLRGKNEFENPKSWKRNLIVHQLCPHAGYLSQTLMPSPYVLVPLRPNECMKPVTRIRCASRNSGNPWNAKSTNVHREPPNASPNAMVIRSMMLADVVQDLVGDI
jgi:hypothetical protein